MMKVFRNLLIGFLIGMISINFSSIFAGKSLTRTYTVKFVVDNDTYKTYKYKYGDEIIYPTYYKEGYYFYGWNYNAPKTMPKDDIVIYGHIRPEEGICDYYKGTIRSYGNVVNNRLVIPSSYIDAQGKEQKINRVNDGSLKINSDVDVYFYGTLEDWCNIIFSTPECNPMYYNVDVYMYNEKREMELLKEIIIPDTITEIKNYQFIRNKNIEKVTIPDSVETIGNEAFYQCEKISSITFTSNTKSIGRDAFYYTHSLKEVYYDGTVEDWLNIDFMNEYATPMLSGQTLYVKNQNDEFAEVKEIEVPSYMTKIKPYTVYSIDHLEKLTFGSNITKLDSPMHNLSQLEYLYFKGSLEDWCKILITELQSTPMYVSPYFYYINESGQFEELKDIVIPDTINVINKYQFYGFTNIESIQIGTSVEEIKANAFAKCGQVQEVYIPSNVLEIHETAFDSTKANTIYCENNERPFKWYLNLNKVSNNIKWNYEKE